MKLQLPCCCVENAYVPALAFFIVNCEHKQLSCNSNGGQNLTSYGMDWWLLSAASWWFNEALNKAWIMYWITLDRCSLVASGNQSTINFFSRFMGTLKIDVDVWFCYWDNVVCLKLCLLLVWISHWLLFESPRFCVLHSWFPLFFLASHFPPAWLPSSLPVVFLWRWIGLYWG